MELLTLSTFRMIVREGGVLAAARRLNTVQSNITSRIRRLEKELGTALFYRKGRGLELTPSGRVLLGFADKLLQLERQAGMAVRMAGNEAGEVRIGSMEAFSAVRLPMLLRALRTRFPALKPSVQTGTSAGLVETVLNHQLDCAFVGGPVEHPDLIIREVLIEELVLVSSVTQRIGDTMILFREGCEYRARALAWQRERGHLVTDLMEMGTLEGILGCVAAGLGITLMPRYALTYSPYRDGLRLTTLPEHISRVPTVLVQHRDALPLSSVMDVLDDVSWSSRNGPAAERAAG